MDHKGFKYLDMAYGQLYMLKTSVWRQVKTQISDPMTSTIWDSVSAPVWSVAVNSLAGCTSRVIRS
jgi:hypothetical protein